MKSLRNAASQTTFTAGSLETSNPLTGYRARLLSRCLGAKGYVDLSASPRRHHAFVTSATPSVKAPTSFGDVGELLEFMQQDAIPYEVSLPPYLREPAARPRKRGGRGQQRSLPASSGTGVTQQPKKRARGAPDAATRRSCPGPTSVGVLTSKQARISEQPGPQEQGWTSKASGKGTPPTARSPAPGLEPPSPDTRPTSISSPSRLVPSGSGFPAAALQVGLSGGAPAVPSGTPAAAEPSSSRAISLPEARSSQIAGEHPNASGGAQGVMRAAPRSPPTASSSMRGLGSGASPSTADNSNPTAGAGASPTAGYVGRHTTWASSTFVSADRLIAAREAALEHQSTLRRAMARAQWGVYLGDSSGSGSGRVAATSRSRGSAQAQSIAAPSPSLSATLPAPPTAGTAVSADANQETSQRQVVVTTSSAPAANGIVVTTVAAGATSSTTAAALPALGPDSGSLSSQLPPPTVVTKSAAGLSLAPGSPTPAEVGVAAAGAPTAPAALPSSPAGARVPAALLPLTLQGRIARLEVAQAAQRVRLAPEGREGKQAPGTASAGKGGKGPPPEGRRSRSDMAVEASGAGAAVAGAAIVKGRATPPQQNSARSQVNDVEGARSGGGGCETTPGGQTHGPPAPRPAPSSLLLSEVGVARELFQKMCGYKPTGREDGASLLAPYARYQRLVYQAAAEAAANNPQDVLQPLDVRQLSTIAAAYAAAGHMHEPFMRVLCMVAYDKMSTASSQSSTSAYASTSSGKGAAGALASASATAALSSSVAAAQGKPLTFRTACVLLTALARLRYRDVQLVAALGRWLARTLRSGAVTPRAKWQGTWLSAALWAYATLEQMADAVVNGSADSNSDELDRSASAQSASGRPPHVTVVVKPPAVTAAGAALFTEAAEAVTVAPGWLQLLDCREALWALWAFRTAASVYGPDDGGGGGNGGAADRGTAASLVRAAPVVPYTPDPLLELKLAGRAASQVDQLDPGYLAEAYGIVAATGFGADRDFLTALRRCTLARVAAARPQPLTVMVAALAVLQVQDVVWLSGLAAACRNQMINMQREQIVVLLHSFAVALRFHYLPLFHAAAVVCSLPGFDRLAAMSAGEVVRLVAAFAAVGHYEKPLVYRAADRILALGPAATLWQRTSVLQSAAHLAHRSNPLLHAVVSEVFNFGNGGGSGAGGGGGAVLIPRAGAAAAGSRVPAALLVAVAAACGQLQYRPRGLLAALHATRVREWPRLGLVQKAAVCWALLALTGGLAAAARGLSKDADSSNSSSSPGGVAEGGGAGGSRDGDSVSEDGKSNGSGWGDAKGKRAQAGLSCRRHGRTASSSRATGGESQDGGQAATRSDLRFLSTAPAAAAARAAEELALLAGALTDYLRALAAVGVRQWPPADNHHHVQVLLACQVLTWQAPASSTSSPQPPPLSRLLLPLQGQQREGPPPVPPETAVSSGHVEQKEHQQQVQQSRAGSAGTAAARAEPVTMLLRARSQQGAAAPLQAPQQQALLAELQGLPAGVVRRVRTVQRKAREAALKPWTEQAAAVVQDIVFYATVATAAAETVGPVAEEGTDADGAVGTRQRRTRVAWLPPSVTLVSGAVTQGVTLCDGALGLDVCVDLDLDLDPNVLEAGVPGPGLGQKRHSMEGKRCEQYKQSKTADPKTPSGEQQPHPEQQQQPLEPYRVRVRLALELCAAPPPGADAIGPATGGGAVVLNSRWLLTGSAALRRRLLAALGVVVVVVREGDWKALRSEQQQRRAMEGWLRRGLSCQGWASGLGGVV